MTIESHGITPEQIRLPENMELKKVHSMFPGEKAYVTPWTLYFDEEGLGWIDLEATPSECQQGTVNMWIGRTEDGFIVDVEEIDHEWRRQEVTAPSESKAPVVGMITNQEERDIVRTHLSEVVWNIPDRPL